MRRAAEIARVGSELKSDSTSQNLVWRVMEVVELAKESQDCKSFYLRDPSGQPLPDFRPGQYVMVRPALAGAYQTTRCYSLSSSPDSRYWRITVKRQDGDRKPDFKRDGGLSTWLHERVGLGDCLLVGGPSGSFFLPSTSTSPLVLVAAGVGITPMASMVRWSLQHTPQRPVHLFYQAKDEAHWPLGNVLHQWCYASDCLHVTSYFSRLTDDGVADMREAFGACGVFEKGRFGVSDVAAQMSPGAEYYLCGPVDWMQSLREGLAEENVPETHIHWESFGSALPEAGIKHATAGDAHDVRFELSDIEVQWNDPQQSLWELARSAGVELPSGCLSGVCGCCKVKLLQGSVRYDREISHALDKQECLACVARPTSDIVIDG